jgi:curved DNA-binding protein CbpA
MSKIHYRQASARIEVPYAEPFVDALKSFIPAGFRNYQPHDHAWIIYTPFVAEARRLAFLYFPDLQEIDKSVFDQTEQERRQREAEAEARRKEQERARQDAYTSGGQWRRREQHNPHDSGDFGDHNRYDYRQTNQNRSQGTETVDPYATLHVTRNAPQKVVEAAYKALARMNHPDLNPNAPDDAMKRINNAYDQIKTAKGWS